MPGGRPPKLKTAEELQKKIDEYFLQDSKEPTISGFALFLGFMDRQSIYDYESRGEEFSCTIKKGLARIESIHEKGLYKPASTGHIFWLKNRGWKDKTELDVPNEIVVNVKTTYVKPDSNRIEQED